MKKISTIIISIFLMLPIMAQEDSQNNKQDNKKTEFSRWSVSVDAGLNAFDGDMKARSDGFFENVRGGVSFGAIVDYTFNPSVSLGLMYNYLPLAANDHVGKEKQSSAEFTSTYHLIAPTLSVNLINVISGTANTKWGLWVNAGVGVGVFSSDLINHKYHQPSSTKTIAAEPTLNGISLAIPIGGTIEYNFTQNLALGLKVQYLTNSRDDLEGEKIKDRYTMGGGVTNDFVSSAAINLRWKFDAKNKQHTRNINWKTYKPNDALALANSLKGDANSIKNTLKEHGELINDLGKRVDDLEVRVGDIEKLLSNDGPDSDGDGVPDHRDREPNTPSNTPVDFWGMSMTPKGYSSVPFIYFPHDKAILEDSMYETIYLAAGLLKANPMLLVEIRGFCDYTGTDEYNLQLSSIRAERVKKELVEVHGIDAKRIGTNGKGRIIEPKAKYRPNRRVEFHFSE